MTTHYIQKSEFSKEELDSMFSTIKMISQDELRNLDEQKRLSVLGTFYPSVIYFTANNDPESQLMTVYSREKITNKLDLKNWFYLKFSLVYHGFKSIEVL